MSDVLEIMLKSLTDKKLALRKHRAALKAHEAKLRPLFADVESLDGESRTDGDWVFVNLIGDKHKFLAFARLIRKHGFQMPNVEKGATGFNKLAYLSESGDNYLTIYFQFSSTVCRRVKVGTKMVEQEVYETVCDELMPYGETPAPAPQAVDDLPF